MNKAHHNKPLPIGVAILSWKAPETIRNTLINYRDNDFFSLFEEVVICFQEISDEDIQLAKEMGIKYSGTEKNTGILGGFQFAYDSLSSEYVMILENDCLLSEDITCIRSRLSDALHHLQQGSAHLFRMRSRYRPGPPVRAASVYSKYYPIVKLAREWAAAEKLDSSPNWLRRIRRLIRPFKARKWIGRSVYVEENPDRIHPSYIQRLGESFIVDSHVLPWTNQPTLVNRRLLKELLDYAEAHPSSRTVNGFQDFEKNLNNNFWRRKHLKIGISKGFFTHKRLDR
jgi:hypothetical protein